MDGRSNQPFAYAFKSAGGGSAALARKLHAHSGHSEALPEGKLSASTAASSSFNPNADVPDKALQPKVFVPHARQTGSAAVPRKVAMERKRREFAEQTSSTSSSIEDLLRARLVDYAAVSGGDMTPAESDSTAAHCASLPLEAFDSSDYEIRSEKNWISLGVDEVTGQQRGVPAIGLYLNAEGFGEWRACRAVAWETRPGPPGGAATVGKFAVVWMNDSSNATIGGSKMRSSLEGHIAAGRSNAADDTEGKGGEFKESDAKIDAELASLVPGGNGVVSRLLRLHVCFASEDPVNFADRLANAFKKRREAAQLIRYLLYVDCMPIEDGPQLLQKQLNAITNQTLAARSLAQIHVAYTNPSQHPPQLRERASTQYSVLQNLLGEVQTDFVRSMNKVIFDGTVEAMRVAKATGQDPAAAAAAAFGASAGGVPTDLALLATVDVPPPTPKAPVPYKALLTIPSHPFAANKEAFSFITLCSKSEVIQVFQRAATENAKIFHKGGATAGFLVGSPGKPLKLDEYETAQATATHQFATFLREGWAQTTRNMVRASLANVGKGNFNLKETNAKAYEYSKLRKLLRNIGFRMADELRYSADAQLHDFTAACEAACEFECVVTSPQAITVTLPGGSGIFKRPPLYALDVIIKDEPITAASGAPSGAPAPAAPAAGAAAHAAPAAAHAKEEKKDPKAKTKEKKENVPMRKVFGYPGANIEALALAPVTAFEKAVRALSGVTTVERMVMDRLFWPEEPTVPCVNFLEPHVQAMKEKMTAKLSKASRPLEAFIRTLDPYVAFLNVDVDEQVNALKTKMAAAGAFNAADCKSAIIKARDSANAVLDALPISVNLGFAVVSVADVRQFIYKKHLSMAEAILKMVAQQAADTSADIGKQYDYMIKSLSAPTTDIESLTQLKEFMTACPEKIKEQQARYVTNLQCYQLLEDYVVPLPKDQFDLQWKALGGAQRVQKKIADVEAELEKEKTKYMEDMAAEQTEFEGTLGDLSDEVNGLSKYGKMDEIEPAAAHCQSLQGRLKVSEEKANLFNLREGLFGKDITNYDKIGDIKKAFEPYFTLWDSANSWLKQHHEWMLGAFINLNPETIERDAGAASRNMARSVKAFEKIGNEGCIQVAKTLRDQCEAFKPLVPLVVALRNPGMRTRHWQELSDQIGEKIDPDKDKEAFTLTIVLEKNLARHIDFINKVGEKAGKEYQLEQALDKMAGEWQTMFMDVFAYRESGTFVVKGVDEQQALLDEHTTMTQAMAFSAFKKPFAERIDQWASTLLTCSEVLDEWLKVQRSWMYLEPIFSSSDIQKQLPTEYKRFATVDKNWRATLLAARGGAGKDAQPQKCIQFCNNAKLLEKWQESNRFLDLVQKGLSDYLETKRAGFARFYFLSNDELLEILSQTKDPRAVQPHLKKCFEGVRSVTFLPTTEIKVMISGEKEKIDLSYLVDPRGKNVEVWMSDFEECMKRSVRACMFTGLSDYTTTPRTQWVQKHPGQIVLNASQMHWTREIEAGIRDMGAEGVKKVYEAQLTQLKDIVVLIRGKLATLARITLGSLTVIDVHARDVTKKLATVGVSTLNDFEWISQLRYKWEGDADTGDFWAMMVSSTRPYGYEYLGNSLRLVITPLTDKCYMTIMSALQMGLGGAPAGPAGTGKTETTKDLAKALAMYW
jgi:dynein heavy chain